ncbi:OsmC family protein [Ramlibacter tataouinensis]|uniref:OsmC family protein n=1 Tax=Ramlibacter tataouinensis TaxID=94132 RepID=UPI0022F3E69A|nr:OsmC family protein [Ramlibacter tataouinensis]WBY02843.1 OsmC family protein [Ramlibacter tataouinensis]
MEIAATVTSSPGRHWAVVRTGSAEHELAVAPKAGGGCATNGGEFLMLALATCYCNDLYREAARLGLTLDGVEVEALAEFAGIGLAASHVRYRASVRSPASPQDIARLLRETDAVAEVHNTLRKGVDVQWLGDGDGAGQP